MRGAVAGIERGERRPPPRRGRDRRRPGIPAACWSGSARSWPPGRSAAGGCRRPARAAATASSIIASFGFSTGIGAAFRRHRLDAGAEGGAGEEDAVRPGAHGIARQGQEALGHRRRQPRRSAPGRPRGCRRAGSSAPPPARRGRRRPRSAGASAAGRGSGRCAWRASSQKKVGERYSPEASSISGSVRRAALADPGRVGVLRSSGPDLLA